MLLAEDQEVESSDTLLGNPEEGLRLHVVRGPVRAATAAPPTAAGRRPPGHSNEKHDGTTQSEEETTEDVEAAGSLDPEERLGPTQNGEVWDIPQDWVEYFQQGAEQIAAGEFLPEGEDASVRSSLHMCSTLVPIPSVWLCAYSLVVVLADQVERRLDSWTYGSLASCGSA